MNLVYRPQGSTLTKSDIRSYNRGFSYRLDHIIRNNASPRVIVNLHGITMYAAAGKCIAEFINSTIVEFVEIVILSNLQVVGKNTNLLTVLARLSKALEDANITALNVSGIDLGGEVVKNLAVVLSRPTLNRVKIEGANLEAADVPILLGHLNSRSLSHISLNNNEAIGPEGAAAIASFLRRCGRQFEHFELGGISPGKVGTLALIKATLQLTKNRNELVHINMKGSEVEGESLTGLKVLAKSITTLDFINVMNSGIPMADQEALTSILWENNGSLDRSDIHVGQDGDDGQVQEDSQFIELSYRG